MISQQEALHLVTAHAIPMPAARIPLSGSLNRVLAEDITADMDLPPFDKSAMDGYACRKEDLGRVLEIIETIPAGVLPEKRVAPGQCSRIMTGSRLPGGADCVIKVEDTLLTDETHIEFTASHTSLNICYRGEDVGRGQTVLRRGTLVGPADMAVLASVGATEPLVYLQPRAGILSTGDELVEPDQVPGESAIRNSNASQLLAQSARLGIPAHYLGIAPDTREHLADMISTAAAGSDIVLITGGVSMGDYDLVPPVLESLGFTVLFRKIAVQPGSPTLFATKDKVYCFGLPGNPVSSFVQFEMLVKPLIYKLMGHESQPLELDIPLGISWKRKKAERLALIPVRIEDTAAMPVEYHGSAHIHAYTRASAIMEVAPGIQRIEKGERVHVRLL